MERWVLAFSFQSVCFGRRFSPQIEIKWIQLRKWRVWTRIVTRHDISVEEKAVTKNYEALNWLQWIAKKAKLTTTTPLPSSSKTTTTTTTTATTTTIFNRTKDPFLELLPPSKLNFPGPPFQPSTSRTSSSSTLMTTTTPSTRSPSSSVPSLTWSWWSPVKNKYEELPLDALEVR